MIDCMVSGFHARVVQHECDQLDGILYSMRTVPDADLRYDPIRLHRTVVSGASAAGRVIVNGSQQENIRW